MRSCPCRDGRRAVPAVPMGQLEPVDDEVFVAVPVDDEVADESDEPDEPDEPLAAGVDVPLVEAPIRTTTRPRPRWSTHRPLATWPTRRTDCRSCRSRCP